MAEHIGWKPSLTAALGKIGETLAVRQVALTSNLIYTIPEGTPSGIVHRVVFTQDGTGGHTVTYGALPVTVALTAGASTTVELHPVGAGHVVRYSGATQPFDIYPGATKAGFISTATAVAATGRMILRVAPGTYNVPDIHPDDISGLYLVGDGVTLTGTPYPNLYPFTTAEWAVRAADAPNRGRGVLAIELDDGLIEHWTTFFPLAKELGVTVGMAWHTANGARWVKEAHRHGWEILSHSPADVAANTLTAAQLETQAIESLDAIEAITGSREDVGFVYPRHARTAETDRVLSKFYSRARGVAGSRFYSRGEQNAWLVPAMSLDGHFVGGVLSSSMKSTLRRLAAADAQLVVYFHYHAGISDYVNEAFRELVSYAKGLGIEFKNPGQVYKSPRLIRDPYLSGTTALSQTGSGMFSLSTDRAYSGAQSVKAAAGMGWTSGQLAYPAGWVDVNSHGQFMICRASARYYSDETVNFSSPAWGGVQFSTSTQVQAVDGSVSVGAMQATGPKSAHILPAAAWGRLQVPVILGPDVVAALLRVDILNLAANTSFYLDEIDLNLVRHVGSLKYSATLAGTTGVKVSTGVWNVGRYAVVATPTAAIAGSLYVTTENDVVTVYSNNAADTGSVNIVISPGWSDLTFAATGA